jgi:hypothetical protein
MNFKEFEQMQAKSRLNAVRLLIATALLITFCWLNWWVMPYLAIVRLDEKKVQVPETCYILMGKQDNKVLGFRILKRFEYGWDSVPAAWPYMLAGMIPALGIGYCIGELARRKFAIDEASRNAIKNAEQIKSDAEKKDSEARKTISKAEILIEDLFYWKKYFDEQLKICRAVTESSEEKIRKCDEKLGEIPGIERELGKARNAIAKLNRNKKAKG